jgi:hypothetical protein
MVTLAALCLAHGLDMHDAAETELARIWTKVEAIRAKQAAKPKHSPLPEALGAPTGLHDIEWLVDGFLSWPLPASVCAYPCATDNSYAFPRSGTKLLTAVEAEQMLRHVLAMDEAS